MEEKEETQETTKDFNLSFLCGACAPPRSFVIHGERERERDASTRRRQLVAKTEGEQTVGLLIVIHSAHLPLPPRYNNN